MVAPKLIAGEDPGTYRLTSDVTDAQLLHLAQNAGSA